MTIQKLPGSAIAPGTVTVVQLESSIANTVQTGGGPKLTNIQITDNAYTVIDDTAVSVSGGYIKITGTGFVAGCTVIIGSVVATSVSFISATEVRAQVPAQAAGTYTVYLVNPDGGVGIRVNGLNYSSTPTWTTTSPLGDGAIDTAVSIQLVATSNSTVTFTLQAGSTLPAGLTLSSSGLITGTVTGITVDTTYNFTVVATDAENQDTPQAFSITITVSDPYFKNTVLLLQADTAPTVITDSSTNNFDLTVVGDTRASSFTPYGTGYSLYTNGSSSYAYLAYNASRSIGTNDLSIECWINVVRQPANYSRIWSHQSNWGLAGSVGIELAFGTVDSLIQTLIDGNSTTYFSATASGASNVALYKNRWCHVLVTRQNGTLRLFLNGILKESVAGATTDINGTSTTSFGTNSQLGGDLTETFISNFRMVIGSVPTSYQTSSTTVDAQIFTPPTTKLTNSSQGAVTGDVKLLLWQDNRFIENISNATINLVSSPAISHNNPFYTQIANGSAYFDGTGDYITVPDNVNLEPLGGNFTIEVWFYLNAVTAGTQICGKSWWTPFYIEGANLVTYLSSNGSTWDIASNQVIITSVGTSRWYHVAMVRNGTSIKAYVNGTEALSLTSSAALHDGSDTLTIGARGTTYLNGYVSDLRFVKGTAVYTANFTPPTQPLTTIANTQLLTLQYRQPHNNHTFLDSSSNQFVITRAGNATQGTFSPFSQTGNSVYFDGTGDYLSLADNEAWTLGSQDFSLEVWIHPTVIPADKYPGIIGHRGGYNLNNGWAIYIGTASYIQFAYSTSGEGSTQVAIGPAITATELLAKWSHILITRSGNQFRFFINGQLRSTYTASNPTIFNSTTALFIGKLEDSADNYFTGYISNVRLIKGSIPAAYQTSSTTINAQIFTPPTQTLSALTGTQLLTCHDNRFIDGSTNNFTVTRNGDAKVTSFGPFSTISYTPALHGGSAYMDGTGDYLSLPSDPAWAFGTGDYTMDCWVYINGITTTQAIMGTNYGTGANLGYDNTSGGRLFAWVVGTQLTATSTNFRVGKWMHVAVTRASGTVRLFLDGVVLNSASMTGSVAASTFYVGTNAHATSTEFLNGYISNARVIKGTALYTGAFTPPTSLVTATANTNLLLNFTDAAIRDGRGIAVLETLGDTKVSTVQTKYGTGSMRFDGTGDGILIPHNDFLHLNNDFTIELWFYANAYGGMIINKGGGLNIAWASYELVIQSDGINFAASSANTGYDIGSETGATGRIGTVVLNTWNHLAVTRSGNIYRGFVNGVQGYTQTLSLTPYNSSPRGLAIGHNYATTWATTTPTSVFNGYIDDLRITNGVARYTANFTPPASKFLSR